MTHPTQELPCLCCGPELSPTGGHVHWPKSARGYADFLDIVRCEVCNGSGTVIDQSLRCDPSVYEVN